MMHRDIIKGIRCVIILRLGFCNYLILYRFINRLKNPRTFTAQLLLLHVHAKQILFTFFDYEQLTQYVFILIGAQLQYLSANKSSNFHEYFCKCLLTHLTPFTGVSFMTQTHYSAKSQNPQPRCNIRHNKFNPVLRLEVLHLNFLVFNS